MFDITDQSIYEIGQYVSVLLRQLGCIFML